MVGRERDRPDMEVQNQGLVRKDIVSVHHVEKKSLMREAFLANQLNVINVILP